MTKFCTFWIREHRPRRQILWHFVLELIAAITYLVWPGLQTDWHTEAVHIVTKFRTQKIYPFLLDFVPGWCHHRHWLSSLIWFAVNDEYSNSTLSFPILFFDSICFLFSSSWAFKWDWNKTKAYWTNAANDAPLGRTVFKLTAQGDTAHDASPNLSKTKVIKGDWVQWEDSLRVVSVNSPNCTLGE